MYFDTLDALLYMEGHGGFVWAAYAITLLVVLYIVIAPLRRQRRLLTELAGELRRDRGAQSQTQPADEEGSHASGS